MDARVEVCGDKALLEKARICCVTPAISHVNLARHERPVVEYQRTRALGPALTVFADFLAVLLRLATQ
eukprot:1449491-Pleurochrysis_carterae.AAC.5